MKRTFTLLWVILVASKLIAQDQEKVTYEEIKQQCSSLPLTKRARVSVTRFNVTTSSVNDAQNQRNARANNILKLGSVLSGGNGNTVRADEVPVTLGDNMATMLTNALQGVNCFRVLETLKNNTDLTSEIDAGDSKYSKSAKAPKAGKQLGAQIVATGEVIEYSVKDKGVNVLGVGTNKKVVKIGFNLKLVNPETRDIITSKVIRVQSKTGSHVSVLGLVNTGGNDPAIAAVMEDGVIQAVQYMAHVRDSLNITVDNIPGNAPKDPNGATEIEVALSGANFTSFNSLGNILSNLPGFKGMEKSFTGGIGSYTVTHTGTADDFLNELNKKLGVKYEVTGFTSDKIEIKAK